MFFFASLVHPCRIEVRKQIALHQTLGPRVLAYEQSISIPRVVLSLFFSFYCLFISPCNLYIYSLEINGKHVF
jgi:hypothetical protein